MCVCWGSGGGSGGWGAVVFLVQCRMSISDKTKKNILKCIPVYNHIPVYKTFHVLSGRIVELIAAVL